MTGWDRLGRAGLRLRDRHLAAYCAPAAAQDAALGHVLTALHGSRFAEDHHLSPEMGLEEFRATVPVRTYDEFRPWLDALVNGNPRSLSSEAPLAFELTGGSSGGRKPVPMTSALLSGFRVGLMAWLGDLAGACPGVTRGPCYFALSPALQRPNTTVGGWPVGLDSDLAYFGDDYAPCLAAHLLFTPGIAALSDPDDWRIATLAMLLAAPDLAFVSVWSPTFLTGLLTALETDPEPALRALADGVAGMAPDPDRARTLSGLETLSPRAIWPSLALVSAWADASAAPSFAELEAALPGVGMQGKGLLATEGLFTLPFAGFPDPVPAILSGLLEFRDADGNCRLMHELDPGESYDLIASPIGGFARYSIGDRVRCTDWARPGVPMLRFAGRGASVSDLVGEKLTEAFVLDCLHHAGVQGVLAARSGPPARYELIVGTAVDDSSLQRLDAALCRNPQYDYARKLGQLSTLGQYVLPDLIPRLTRARLGQGHRLSDIKPPVLLSETALCGVL